MRTLAHVSVAALLWVGVMLASGGQSSKMVLKMDKDQVEIAQKALAEMKGVQKVSYDEKRSELVILYDKPTLGCCSRIHSTLQQAGVKYTLVSNQEAPACKQKDHHQEHSEATIPAKPAGQKGKKSCCQKGAKTTCSKGV